MSKTFISNIKNRASITCTIFIIVEIAKILNCSQRVYSNYERGDLDIPTEILIKLAKYYDVSTDYILGISDKKKPNK